MTAENRVNFESLGKVDVQPGVVIEGFPGVEAIDDLVKVLRDVVAETHFPGEQLSRSMVFVHFPSQVLENQTHRRFTGRLQNLRVIIMPPDPSFVTIKPENIVPDSALNFLAEVDMHSSGRGVVGTISREFCMYVRYRRNGTQAEAAPYVMLTSRSRGPKASTQWDKVVDQSRKTYMGVWKRALSRVVSGGLPTLGKNR